MAKLFRFVLVCFLFSGAFSKLSSQEIGLVLAGGGGKGAYEVGVWKAFYEYGLAQKVTAISGTSVGGLNGALFACENIDRVIGFWKQFVPKELWESPDLLDEEGLLRIIDKVNLSKLQDKNSYPKVFVTATRSRFLLIKEALRLVGIGDYAHRFLLNEEKDLSEIKKLLLATSAVPILTKAVKLKDGKKYVDGGLTENVPVYPFTNENEGLNLDMVIVVHLKKENQKYTGVKDLYPSENLGGLAEMLDFSSESVNYLIELGYNDAVKFLKEQNLYPVSDYWFY